MSRVRVEAPGKLVVLGEYAVLDGAPGIVAAVDRGVACDATAGRSLEVRTPGDDRFVRAALEAAHAPPATYCFSTWNPTHTTTKAGLGSSAAATVAAVVAARALAGVPHDPATVFEVAARVHADVQGGGSGIDVAASAHGGMLRYERGIVSPTRPLALTVVFSGSSAATAPRVRRYLGLANRQRFVDASRAAIDVFASDPIEGMRQASVALTAMCDAAGIVYWTPALRRIAAIAADHGGVSKPSGAGGGDCAIALFDDDPERRAFVRVCEAEGRVVIPTALAAGAAPSAQEGSEDG